MSETRLQATLLLALVIVLLLGVALFVLSPYLHYIVIGLGVILVFGFAAAGWHKWQHARLPIKADKREALHLAHLHEMEREHLLLEQERHAHELRLEQEKHQQELDLRQRTFDLQQHLALSRASYDQNGNPPIFLGMPDMHITTLPAGNPHYVLRGGRTHDDQKLLPPAESQTQVIPAPIDVYTLLSSGQWYPTKAGLLLAISLRGLIAVAINLAWHIALAGSTGAGKTNELRLILTQLVKFYEVYYISPAFAPIKANHEDWRQIEAYLAGPIACEAEEIRARLQWAVEMYKYRQIQERSGDFTWRDQPIYIVIDEYIAVCKRYPQAADDVSELLRFARQYPVFVVVASQDFLIKNIGGDSGARDCYRTALYFGGDPVTARALLDIRSTLPYEQDLGKDGHLVLRTRSTQVSQARAPFMSNRAIYEILGWPEDPILDDSPLMSPVPAGTFTEPYGPPEMEPLQPHTPGTWYPPENQPEYAQEEPTTSTLPDAINADGEPAEQGTGEVPVGTADKQFTLAQEMEFIRRYRASGSIKESILAMHLSYGRYQKCASQIVKRRKLRKVSF